MKNREFLIWLHERLEHCHNTHPQRDYMQKLRSIIKVTDPSTETPNTGSGIDIKDLV